MCLEHRVWLFEKRKRLPCLCGESGHSAVSASAQHFTPTVSFNPAAPLFKLCFLHFAGVGGGTQGGCYLSGFTVCIREGHSQLDTDLRTPEYLLGEQEKTAPGKLDWMVWVLSVSKCLGLWGQKRRNEDSERIAFLS